MLAIVYTYQHSRDEQVLIALACPFAIVICPLSLRLNLLVYAKNLPIRISIAQLE